MSLTRTDRRELYAGPNLKAVQTVAWFFYGYKENRSSQLVHVQFWMQWIGAQPAQDKP